MEKCNPILEAVHRIEISMKSIDTAPYFSLCKLYNHLQCKEIIINREKQLAGVTEQVFCIVNPLLILVFFVGIRRSWR